MTPLYTATYPSPLGTIVLSSDGTSLTGLRFADEQSGDAVSLNTPEAPNAINCEALNTINGEAIHPLLSETILWLDDYFAGRQPHTLPRLNPHGTAFQKRVWQALFTIGYGQTRTYGEIARLIGCRSAQAVGQALTRNPIAIIIPCHRVLAAHGSLGGYAYGLPRKQQLLQFDSCMIS